MVDDARLRRIAVHLGAVCVGLVVGFVWPETPPDWRVCIVGAAIGLTLVLALVNRRPA